MSLPEIHDFKKFSANGKYNELRIDAAGMEKVKRNGEGAAASVLVELSRIWKKKPGGTVKKSQKEIHPTNKERSGKYFT